MGNGFNSTKLSSLMARLVAEPPSREEVISQINIDARSNPTTFSNWYDAAFYAGVPSPKTVVIDFPVELQFSLIELDDSISAQYLPGIIKSVRDAGDLLGWPLFIKNELFSGKHHWLKTCYLPEGITDEGVADHLSTLNKLHHTFVKSGVNRLVVREFIETEPVMTAFEGMPVTREFRFFTDDEGDIEGYQPYWPTRAIDGHTDALDWRDRLEALSRIDNDTLLELSQQAEKVVKLLNERHNRKIGFSVDFLQGKDGRWYLIDMAEASKSYRCDEGFKYLDNNYRIVTRPGLLRVPR